MATIWIPLPDRDFDVTEVAVPWRLLTDAGHTLVFATENGDVPSCDRLLLTPMMFGSLGARPEPKSWYLEMEQSEAFRQPATWEAFVPEEFDGILLPGGHAQGMKQYLASETLQRKVAAYWALERPVGAICHGVVLLARSKNLATGKSVLHGRQTSGLPKYMEWLGYALSAWKLGGHYRTYPAYVQDEVQLALGDVPFVRGPINLGHHGTANNDAGAMVVEDGHYISARWPGDAYLFARRFMALLPAARG